jgi:lipopolysaccharide/colanic/teichoic acid biosynthesis glycosyltransferase
MQAEYQSPESRTAAIEGSYSYTESVGRSLGRSQRANTAPSEFFRYRMIKRCCDIFLVLISMPVMLPILGMVSAVVMLSSPGPIFYSHRRIRKSGAFFSMW